jgi:hypothetical protein
MPEPVVPAANPWTQTRNDGDNDDGMNGRGPLERTKPPMIDVRQRLEGEKEEQERV